jgi:hypothetical protein
MNNLNNKITDTESVHDDEVQEEEEEEDDILESTILATTSDYNDDEDGAIFRSVAIMPTSSSIATTNVFGAPSLTQSGPSSMFHTRSDTKARVSGIAGTSLVGRSNWRLSGATPLPTVPICYPLERTHVIVSLDDMSIAILTSLISSLAQKLSLACEYESDCQAYLTAEDGTLISVQLFLDEDDFGDDSTILEVQKRAGKSETFFFLANKLLQVSKGVEHVENMDLTAGKPHIAAPLLKIPYSMVGVMESSEDEEMENAQSTLAMAAGLLKSGQSDSKELGLKLLTVLTDSARSSIVSCRVASRAVLSSEQFGSCFQDILDQQFSESDTFYEDDLMSSYNDVLKKEALQVFANALSICVNESLSVDSGWIVAYRPTLVSQLVVIVEQATARPHEAVLAIRCLEGLIILFPEARQQALDLDLGPLVVQAKLIGECTHADLFQESERVFGRMTAAGLISA